jgi:hypothetical protein
MSAPCIYTVPTAVLQFKILAGNLTYDEVVTFGATCRLFYAATRTTRERLQRGAAILVRIRSESVRRVMLVANALSRTHSTWTLASAYQFVIQGIWPNSKLFVTPRTFDDPNNVNLSARIDASRLNANLAGEHVGVRRVHQALHWLCNEKRSRLLQFLAEAPMTDRGHRQPPVFANANDTHEFLAEVDNAFWALVVGNARATDVVLAGHLSTVLLRTDLPHEEDAYGQWPRETERTIRSASKWFNFKSYSYLPHRKELSYRYRFLAALFESEHGRDILEHTHARHALPTATAPLALPTRIWRILFDQPWTTANSFLCNLTKLQAAFGLHLLNEAEYACEMSLFDAQVIATAAELITVSDLLREDMASV